MLDYEDKIRRDLVASVTHELRTPVAVLQAGHEALLDGVTEPGPEDWGRCATRCSAWPAWWTTCRRWPPPTRPSSS